ncbi:uncharacterized protein LOC108035520 isoform X2 [Drosophila biarmipes]|nr:uncharacterized protein LOC108035520 isoform X2 [Drosophila biarmipes]
MAYVTQNSSYGNWNEFLLLSDFREGLMVTPYRGVYKLIDGQVELKSYPITEQPRPGFLPKIKDCFITPESLSIASKTPVIRKKSENAVFQLVPEFCAGERMLSLLLNPDSVQKSCDLIDLSDSLVLFTQTFNNFRLAKSMLEEANCLNILVNQERSVFDKISEEAVRINGKVDLIRSSNGVPLKSELDILLQPIQKKRKPKKLPETPKEPIDVLENSPEINTVKVKGEDIDLAVYGKTLRDHIVSLESFELLITSMAEHLEPEIFKLILQLTQTFVENTREEMSQLLKYYFSTESVLYQIICSIRKHYPSWNFNEIKEQSSEILRRLRYYFASSDPNSRSEFLKKCEKCTGYYDLYNKY